MVNKKIYAIVGIALIILFSVFTSLVLGQETPAVPKEPPYEVSTQPVSSTGFTLIFFSLTIIFSAIGIFLIHLTKKLQIVNLVLVSILGIAALLFFIGVGFEKIVSGLVGFGGDDALFLGIPPLIGFLLASVYLFLIIKFLKSKKEENGWIKFASWLNVGIAIIGIIMIVLLFSFCFMQIRGMCDDIGTPLAALMIAFVCGSATLISFILYIIGIVKLGTNKNEK